MVFSVLPKAEYGRRQIRDIVTTRQPRTAALQALINAVIAQWGLSAIDAATFGFLNSPSGDSQCAITSGLAVLTSPNSPWLASDVGRTIHVQGAGAAGATLVTTIAGFTSAGQVTLTAVASTTVTGTDAASSGLAVWGDPSTATLPDAGQLVPSLTGYDRQVTGSANPLDLALVTAAGSTATRTLAARFGEVYNVKDFGAVGNGVTDDSVAILAAFNAARSAGAGIVLFPRATYLHSYGFNVPANCAVMLQGSYLKASTTYGQGAIPTNGTNQACFLISNGAASGIVTDIANIAIIGAGATIDGQRNNQTGSPGGYGGIVIRTSDVPILADLYKIHDLVVSDVVIRRVGYDGIYCEGTERAHFINCTVLYALRLGNVNLGVRGVTYTNCEFSYTVGDNASLAAGQQGPGNSGSGVWNEPDYAWQEIVDLKYIGCRARYNYQSGFKLWNAGQDAKVQIKAIGCHSYNNTWNEVTQADRTAVVEAGYVVNLTATGTASFDVTMDNCVAKNEWMSGFKISRGAATGANHVQRINLLIPVAEECNRFNADSAQSSAINIPSGAGYAAITIKSPVLIAPAANTLGYAIYCTDFTNVWISDPTYRGVFTYACLVNGASPASRISSGRPFAVIDSGPDANRGSTGTTAKWWRPIMPAYLDNDTEPVAGDLVGGELFVHKTTTNAQTGLIYLGHDGATKRYIDSAPRKRLRAVNAYAGATIGNGTPVAVTQAVTGCVLGDRVTVSASVDQNQIQITGYVSAAGTVTIILACPNSVAKTIAACNLIINVEDSGY